MESRTLQRRSARSPGASGRAKHPLCGEKQNIEGLCFMAFHDLTGENGAARLWRVFSEEPFFFGELSESPLDLVIALSEARGPAFQLGLVELFTSSRQHGRDLVPGHLLVDSEHEQGLFVLGEALAERSHLGLDLRLEIDLRRAPELCHGEVEFRAGGELDVALRPVLGSELVARRGVPGEGVEPATQAGSPAKTGEAVEEVEGEVGEDVGGVMLGAEPSQEESEDLAAVGLNGKRGGTVDIPVLQRGLDGDFHGGWRRSFPGVLGSVLRFVRVEHPETPFARRSGWDEHRASTL